MQKHSLILAAALFALLSGCSDTPTSTATKKEPEKVEPVTGQTALYRMYQSARTWASDAKVLKLPQPAHHRGARRSSGIGRRGCVDGDVRVGVQVRVARLHLFSRGGAGQYAQRSVRRPERKLGRAAGVNSPFLIAAVKVDTDAAYKTALEKAADYEKKNPGKPITYILEKTTKHPDPAWRVLWGESVAILQLLGPGGCLDGGVSGDGALE